jgi:hypothetical protein
MDIAQVLCARRKGGDLQSWLGVAFIAWVCTASLSVLAQSLITDQGRAVVFMVVS